MTTDILLVTPSIEFGDAVRRSVEDSEIYRIHVARDIASALVRAGEEKCPVALLDLTFGEEGVLKIGRALRSTRPDIQLVVLCGEQTPPSLDAIRPWSLMRIPLHLEDLIRSIPVQDEAESGVGLTAKPQNPYNQGMLPAEGPTWMTDVTKAAAILTRLTLGSAAQAALITRQGEVWAYVGSLSQEAAREIAHTVKRRREDQSSSDLICFIRLESTRAQHMLYATRLGEDTELAFVFESETPFSTIRSQARQLITSLDIETHLSSTGTEQPDVPETLRHPTGELRKGFEFDEQAETGEAEINLPPISEILTNVPSPDPNQSQTSDADSNQGIQWPRRGQHASTGETRMAPPLSNAQVFKTGEQPRRERPVDSREMDATRLSPTTDAQRKISLEPLTAGLYHLTYACLFVPRFSNHYMTGDLADKISEWLPNICVSFGWRLESLSVRPEYLQFVVNVQPNTSPGFVMRMMRQFTNEKIFQTFGRIKKENPSGDFWAPGYLILGGSNPHPPQLIRDYIKQIRIRQGLEARR